MPPSSRGAPSNATTATNRQKNHATGYALRATGAAAVPLYRGLSRLNDLRCLVSAAGLLRRSRGAARARRVTLQRGGRAFRLSKGEQCGSWRCRLVGVGLSGSVRARGEPLLSALWFWAFFELSLGGCCAIHSDWRPRRRQKSATAERLE